MKLTEDIKNLIFLSVWGKLEEEEEKRLKDWLEQPGNKDVYERLTDRQRIAERMKVLRRHDREKVWKRLEKQLFEERKIRFYQWCKIAAVLILPLIWGVWLWNVRHTCMPDNTPPSGGELYPVLHLASGEKVCLSGDSVFQTSMGQLANQSGRLVCNAKTEGGKLQFAAGYNEIKIPRGAEYQVVLPDRTKVWMNSGASLRFPDVFAGKERKVYVTGELYFEVSRDSLAPFRVITGEKEIEVLGTSFNIRSYQDEPYVATLVSGSVCFRNGAEKLLLKPGEQVWVNQEEKLRVCKADLSRVTAWKRGYFVFKNESLENIVKELERWYDMSVFFEGEKVRQKRFSLEFRRHYSLEEVVGILRKTGSLNIEVKTKAVVIEDI